MMLAKLETSRRLSVASTNLDTICHHSHDYENAMLNNKKTWNFVTGAVKYTPSKTMSFWTDFHPNGDTQFGLFAGYTKNQGFKDDIFIIQPGLGLDIESLYSVSP
jgi:hypothetical protein